MKPHIFALVLLLAPVVNVANAENNAYADIAKRHAGVALSSSRLAQFKMQGECLAGLKQLNFRKSNKFDPVAEWTSYRSLSLLEQFPPCEVLIMVEVARSKIQQQAK